MLIVSANHKGGCGKTFLSSLLYGRARARKIEGLVIADLDEQESFKMRHENAVVTDNPLAHVGVPRNCCICDTPPSILSRPEIIKIIQAADVLVIPTFCDLESVNAAARVFSLKGQKSKTVIVPNHWEGLSRETQALEYLETLGATKILVLKKHNRIPLNFDTKTHWESGLTIFQREAISDLLDTILDIGGLKK